MRRAAARSGSGSGSGIAAAPSTRRCCRSRRPVLRVRASSHGSGVVAGGKVYIDPVKQECKAFAPATVANLGPGFDWLGCAVEVSRQRSCVVVLSSCPALHGCPAVPPRCRRRC